VPQELAFSHTLLKNFMLRSFRDQGKKHNKIKNERNGLGKYVLNVDYTFPLLL
jgi:hypothetical protein